MIITHTTGWQKHGAYHASVTMIVTQNAVILTLAALHLPGIHCCTAVAWRILVALSPRCIPECSVRRSGSIRAGGLVSGLVSSLVCAVVEGKTTTANIASSL